MISNQKTRAVARTIIENPGITVKGITKATGLPSRRVRDALTSLETCGFLVSEDPNGRLYPFDPCDTWNLVADLMSDPKDTNDDEPIEPAPQDPTPDRKGV